MMILDVGLLFMGPPCIGQLVRCTKSIVLPHSTLVDSTQQSFRTDIWRPLARQLLNSKWSKPTNALQLIKLVISVHGKQ